MTIETCAEDRVATIRFASGAVFRTTLKPLPIKALQQRADVIMHPQQREQLIAAGWIEEAP